MSVRDGEGGIGARLRASGLVDAWALEKAQEHAKEAGRGVVDALLELELVKEQDLLKHFADGHGGRFIRAEKLRQLKVDDELLERVGVRAAQRLRLCPIRWIVEGGELQVAAAVPISPALEADLKQSVGARSVSVLAATPGAVAALVRRSFLEEAGAFDSVTPNGAGPSMPGRPEGPSSTLVELEPVSTPLTGRSPVATTVGGAMPFDVDGEDEAPPPREGKTVVVNLNEMGSVAELKKENARLRIAQEFHRRVTLDRSLDAVIQRILEVLFELLPAADGVALWLTQGELKTKSKSGDKAIDVPRAVIDQTMIATGALLTHNALTDERFDRSQSVMVRGVRSVMSVPLRTRSGTLGVLYVESLSMSAAFSSDDVPLLDSIGAQAATLLDNAQLLARVQQEVEHRSNLSRFLSPAAVEEVLSGRMKLSVEGQLAEITVLFADLRGFTTLSAHMKPSEVVAFLNHFFSEAVQAVENHGGVVDKFIGDCVMAMWGAPVVKEEDARSAVKAALEMVERGRKITAGGAPLEIGVGINTGLAVVGAIGSARRSDYTAIGSTVNTAARLCGMARANEVLITSDTLLRCGPGVDAVANEPVVLKGLDVPTVPYTVKSVAQPLLLNTPLKMSRVVPPSTVAPKRPSGRK